MPISIHAPREGGDAVPGGVRRRGKISIHAPREGGDGILQPALWARSDFNPRPPRGGRRPADRYMVNLCYFNPRPPRGGRPAPPSAASSVVFNFNPRPPRGGRLAALERLEYTVIDFNPRPPRGGRQQKQPNDSTVFTKKQTIITNGVLKIRLITNMLCVLLKISFRIRCEAAALFCLLELRI